MSRGILTDEVAALAVEHFGREISVAELRLLPYIGFVMVNEQRIDPRKINVEERQILQIWRDEGLIEGGAGGLYITRDFWDAINDIVWLAYVVAQDGELPR